jgi:ArsR family transcriptional regulator
MKDKFLKTAELFKALGHPIRLRIVEGLLKGECNVSHMVSCLNIPQATVSQHLNVLKASGIIEGERKGTQVCYKVINEKVEKLIGLVI